MLTRHRQDWRTFILIAGLMAPMHNALAMDTIVFTQHETSHEVVGRAVVEAQDGGLLFESCDRQIWVLTPDLIERRKADDSPFNYLGRKEIAARLTAEFPGFKVHNTAHYVICYNTSPAYARWCGSLYERLYDAYFNFWRRRNIDVHEPDFLVSLVFRDQPSYASYGSRELGETVSAVIGFYSLSTNRMTTYDITGIEAFRQPGDRTGSLKHINDILSRPGAERTVATLIHEATHQLAFNSGLENRFADNPLWLSEGLAIYFEAPDLSAARGWRKIGAMHPARLRTFQNSRAQRPPDSLRSLLTDDNGRFRDASRAEQSYAEAWALCYYLMRQKPAEFRTYLQAVGQKKVLQQDSAEVRLRDFQQAFGGTWEEVDTEFLRAADNWR